MHRSKRRRFTPGFARTVPCRAGWTRHRRVAPDDAKAVDATFATSRYEHLDSFTDARGPCVHRRNKPVAQCTTVRTKFRALEASTVNARRCAHPTAMRTDAGLDRTVRFAIPECTPKDKCAASWHRRYMVVRGPAWASRIQLAAPVVARDNAALATRARRCATHRFRRPSLTIRMRISTSASNAR